MIKKCSLRMKWKMEWMDKMQSLSRLELKSMLIDLMSDYSIHSKRSMHQVFEEKMSKTVLRKKPMSPLQQNFSKNFNILSPYVDKNLSNSTIKRQKKSLSTTSNKKRKEFEMGYYARRHVALHICYFGQKYDGFASQNSTSNTVEEYLFAALIKAKLIKDRKSCSYSRCGRTDKGVSAITQVLTITLRSKLKNPQPVESTILPSIPKQSNESQINELNNLSSNTSFLKETDKDEIDYVNILNRLLPDNIMVLGWCPAPSFDFKARFNAESRTYRYYFYKRGMDLDAMKLAISYLIGEHDFRNFCKIDIMNTRNFIRVIKEADIVELNQDHKEPESICYIMIKGNAFLWHQVRFIATILFHIGRGEENPELVKDLLNIKLTPARPAYGIANPEPLTLYDNFFPDIQFYYDPHILSLLRRKLEFQCAQLDIQSTIQRAAIYKINELIQNQTDTSLVILPPIDRDFPCSNHSIQKNPKLSRKILDLPKLLSYEEKLNQFLNKKNHPSSFNGLFYINKK